MAKAWSWNEPDLKRLSIYVRKFNTAITRLEKQAPELKDSGALPERLATSELKSRILNKRDYNRELAKIDRFFKKGERDIVLDKTTGFRTTRWAKKENKLLEKRINEQKMRFIKKYNIPKSQWEFLGLNPVDLAKEQKKIIEKASKLPEEDQANEIQNWYNIIYSLERESSSGYLEANFAKLRNAYFKAIGEHMPKELANDLIKYLEDNDVWGSDIIWAISQNDILDFEFIYSLEEAQAKAEIMKERWEEMLPILKQQVFYKNKPKVRNKKKT